MWRWTIIAKSTRCDACREWVASGTPFAFLANGPTLCRGCVRRALDRGWMATPKISGRLSIAMHMAERWELYGEPFARIPLPPPTKAEIAEAFCRDCRALPGEHCRTVDGRVRAHYHMTRVRDAKRLRVIRREYAAAG